MKKKNIYIIAGPNGSGKTTFATEFLLEYAQCPRFINADLIATGLSPFSPKQEALKAGKLVISQIKEFSEKGLDFGFETTLSGKTYLKHLKEFKEKGYMLNLFFLWIPSSQLAIARVKDRVEQGGHNVPVEDIKRRFDRSIINFFKEYRPLLDKWMFFNNSGVKPELIAKKDNLHIDIIDEKVFSNITKKRELIYEKKIINFR